MMELRRSREACVPRQTSAVETASAQRLQQRLLEATTTPESRPPLDNVEALLEEYERSKRGFRTNPFLQDEHEKMLIANRCMSTDDDGRERNKDSETHRKAWAETIGAALEFALALTVSLGILVCG